MPLNFHGHILMGNAKKIMVFLDGSPEMAAESGLTWEDTILAKITVNQKLARWCYYRLTLCPYPTRDIGSAESIVLRTAVWRLIEALYLNWELVVTYFPKLTVEAAIDEFQEMAKISAEYPVMLWEYFDEESQATWVPKALAGLPSLESMNQLYELPHMRAMYINGWQDDFCDNRDRDAQKAYRRALAERNKRLNRAAKEKSRGEKR